MEDSFRVRVDKIFGSLASSSFSSSSSSSSSQSVNSSLWSLTDDEVEKIQWNRQKDRPHEPHSTPYPSSFDAFFPDHRFRNLNMPSTSQSHGQDFRKPLETDLQHLDDDYEDEKPSRGGSAAFNRFAKPDDHDDEEWDIRSNIGKDCTLDYEEEEDEYDEVAVGREKGGERLYMKDVRDDEDFEVPNSFNGGFRDSRANNLAAKLRLKRDAAAAASVESEDASAAPKSILKRKGGEMGSSKSQKRVRFDSSCKTESAEEGKDAAMEEALGKEWSSGVPDYIRNPSRYTHYTFESMNEMDEASNRQAYMDFLNLVRKSEEAVGTRQQELPKSVAFTPRRKAVEGGAVVKTKQERECVDNHHKKAAFPVGIAAGDSVQSEACAMEVEEDEEPTKIAAKVKSSGSGRRYRVRRSSLDLDECVT